MVDSVGGFDPAAFAANIAQTRKQDANQDAGFDKLLSGANPSGATDSSGLSAAAKYLKDYNKKSPIERMEDAWLKKHNLTREQLAALPKEQREALMKEMKDDIQKQLKEMAKNKQNAGVDISA